MGSGAADLSLVQCEDCGWRGTVSECTHTYEPFMGIRGFDSELVNECPKCGSRNLTDIEGKKMLVGV